MRPGYKGTRFLLKVLVITLAIGHHVTDGSSCGLAPASDPLENDCVGPCHNADTCINLCHKLDLQCIQGYEGGFFEPDGLYCPIHGWGSDAQESSQSPEYYSLPSTSYLDPGESMVDLIPDYEYEYEMEFEEVEDDDDLHLIHGVNRPSTTSSVGGGGDGGGGESCSSRSSRPRMDSKQTQQLIADIKLATKLARTQQLSDNTDFPGVSVKHLLDAPLFVAIPGLKWVVPAIIVLLLGNLMLSVTWSASAAMRGRVWPQHHEPVKVPLSQRRKALAARLRDLKNAKDSQSLASDIQLAIAEAVDLGMHSEPLARSVQSRLARLHKPSRKLKSSTAGRSSCTKTAVTASTCAQASKKSSRPRQQNSMLVLSPSPSKGPENDNSVIHNTPETAYTHLERDPDLAATVPRAIQRVRRQGSPCSLTRSHSSPEAPATTFLQQNQRETLEEQLHGRTSCEYSYPQSNSDPEKGEKNSGILSSPTSSTIPAALTQAVADVVELNHNSSPDTSQRCSASVQSTESPQVVQDTAKLSSYHPCNPALHGVEAVSDRIVYNASEDPDLFLPLECDYLPAASTLQPLGVGNSCSTWPLGDVPHCSARPPHRPGHRVSSLFPHHSEPLPLPPGPTLMRSTSGAKPNRWAYPPGLQVLAALPQSPSHLNHNAKSFVPMSRPDHPSSPTSPAARAFRVALSGTRLSSSHNSLAASSDHYSPSLQSSALCASPLPYVGSPGPSLAPQPQNSSSISPFPCIPFSSASLDTQSLPGSPGGCEDHSSVSSASFSPMLSRQGTARQEFPWSASCARVDTTPMSPQSPQATKHASPLGNYTLWMARNNIWSDSNRKW